MGVWLYAYAIWAPPVYTKNPVEDSDELNEDDEEAVREGLSPVAGPGGCGGYSDHVISCDAFSTRDERGGAE